MIFLPEAKPILEFLQIMVIRGCNLSCSGCTTFSDLQHSGYVQWNTGKQWLKPWIDRLEIKAVGIMGGEPLMNPQINDWLLGIRKEFPLAQIRFVTNGLLLHKHWDIVNLLDSLGNSVLKISYHINDNRLDTVIDRIFKSRKWSPINEWGIDRWYSESGFRFQISKPTRFLKTFRGDFENMLPHENLPQEAFKICVQKKCPLLYQGKIYKCATSALTPELLNRMGKPNYTQWLPYLHAGLDPNCTDQDLMRFIENFGKPLSSCRQCPSLSDIDSLLDHTKTVMFK